MSNGWIEWWSWYYTCNSPNTSSTHSFGCLLPTGKIVWTLCLLLILCFDILLTYALIGGVHHPKDPGMLVLLRVFFDANNFSIFNFKSRIRWYLRLGMIRISCISDGPMQIQEQYQCILSWVTFSFTQSWVHSFSIHCFMKFSSHRWKFVVHWWDHSSWLCAHGSMACERIGTNITAQSVRTE